MLHREFAIDPALFRRIEDLQVLDGRFGFDNGAMISRFPKGWYAQVVEGLKAQLTDKQVDTISDQLQWIKNNMLVALDRGYSGDPWSESATISHHERPFHRVLSEDLDDSPIFLKNWNQLTPRDFHLTPIAKRTAESISALSEMLLHSAERVTLVDPYAKITDRGFQKTLKALMAKCRKAAVSFLVISEEIPEGHRDYEKHGWELMGLPAIEQFKRDIPENITLKWLSLDDGGTGELHDRFIFTSKGGIVFGRSFAEPAELDQKEASFSINLMSLAQLEIYSKQYNEYQISEPLSMVRPIWSSK